MRDDKWLQMSIARSTKEGGIKYGAMDAYRGTYSFKDLPGARESIIRATNMTNGVQVLKGHVGKCPDWRRICCSRGIGRGTLHGHGI